MNKCPLVATLTPSLKFIHFHSEFERGLEYFWFKFFALQMRQLEIFGNIFLKKKSSSVFGRQICHPFDNNICINSL